MESNHRPKPDLKALADLAMASHGLEAQFPEDALKQLAALTGPAQEADSSIKDLKGLLWCSIDNDDSRDLDQLTVAEKLKDGSIKVYVSIADVDALVMLGSPLDLHAKKNTTSVYTGVKTYPMLPEQLSTDWTSLNSGVDRISLVMEMTLSPSGELTASQVYRAWVRNKAKLAYNGVGAWLEGRGSLPPVAAKVPGLADNLRLQDEAAQSLKTLRDLHGALELETLQPRPVTQGDEVVDLSLESKNRAGQIIEDFMIAANGVTARFLTQKGFPTLRRVVKVPERWDRIVELAEELGEKLPPEPDSKALNEFLKRRKEKDPLRFPDLSLMVVKLIGRGEYMVEVPGQTPVGHFGLAVRDYSHSTAPNRRYPDLITHRLIKAALSNSPSPYAASDLDPLAQHCTEQENNADKVERQVRKSASAAFMSNRIGEHFDAIITGASEKGTWIRLLNPPVEGKLVQNAKGLDVGHRIRVKLIMVNIEQGWIDFARTN